MITDQYQTKF